MNTNTQSATLEDLVETTVSVAAEPTEQLAVLHHVTQDDLVNAVGVVGQDGDVDSLFSLTPNLVTADLVEGDAPEPLIELNWSADDFMSDEESEEAIKLHNDALDGSAGKSEDAVPGDGEELQGQDSEQAIAEGVEAQDTPSAVDEPFLGFASARTFMGSGQSLEAALGELRKPPFKAVDQDAATRQAMIQAEAGSEQQQKQANAHNVDERLQMNLGKAALMMGGMGLLKLGDMVGKSAGLIGKGAGFVGSGIGNAITQHQTTKAEKEMAESLSVLTTSLDGLRGQGLGQLDDRGVSLAERQEMAKQFFAQPGNGKALEAMFDSVTKMKRQARILIEKGVNAGDSADAVMERVLEPMRRLTEKNEPFLESLKMGNDSLLDKMDSAMNGLFETLKRMFQQLGNALGLGSGAAEKKSGPSMG